MDLAEWIAQRARGRPPGGAALRGPTFLCRAGRAGRRRSPRRWRRRHRRGARVACLGLNSPQMLALLFACARLGALFMPLNWRLGRPSARQMLDECPPALLFVDEPFVAASAERCGSRPARLHRVRRRARGLDRLDAFLAGASAALLRAALDAARRC